MSSIITTEELTTYTGETLNEAMAAQVVAAVNEYIESVTGRSWGAVATATETHDYAPVVFLRHQDVTGVTEVKRGQRVDDRTVVDANNYFVNDFGRLVLSESGAGFHRTRDYVHVTYTYGVTTVPADLKLAALSLGQDFYSYASDGQTEISSEGIGSYRLQYASGSSSATGSVHFSTINRYRTRRV